MRASLILVLSLLSAVVFSQSQLSTKSKKAAELYYQADNYRVRGQYNVAVQLLEQAIDKDDKFHEAYFRLGVIYKAKKDLNRAEELLLNAYELSEGKNAGATFELAELYLFKAEYTKSIKYIDEFFAAQPKNQRRIQEARKIKTDAEFALDNLNEASEFDPRPLSDNVNTFAMQYFPILTVDEQSIIYTRRLGTSMDHDEDLVISTKSAAGEWQKPISLSENINSEFNEGTCTLSADGRVLIFTSCYGRKGYGSCDLYISKKQGEEWSVPVNLGANVNSSAWESQPSLSSDGRTLYFISNRGGGIGGRDIWVSEMDDNDVWTKPRNLGKNINTLYDEVSPFIHPNNKTLYFASNGLTGFGGFDIFYTEKENKVWSQPVNMGSPINTGADQVSLFITANGKKGYYSHEVSNNAEQKGAIFEFEMPEKSQTKYATSYVHGRVFDAETKKPLQASVELIDLGENQREALVQSDSINGKYLIVLREGSEFALYINKAGYLFESISFNYQQKDELEPVKLDVYLKPVREGEKIVLNNIFFDIDSYQIQNKSGVEIEKIIKFLTSNPSAHVEIGGHTDNTGNESYNTTLSIKRAQAVYNLLIEKGVPKSRLAYEGYGQSKPAFPNDNEENRKLNRRIEFKVIR